MDRYQKLIQEKAAKKREFMGQMFFPRTPILLLDFSNVKISVQHKDLLKGLNDIGLVTFVIAPDEVKGLVPGKNLRYMKSEMKANALEAADFAIIFDSNVHYVWEKGCVPISQINGEKTIPYNPLQEKGNGFYFKNPTKWEIFATIIRALETYQFPYDWENLIREILKK